MHHLRVGKVGRGTSPFASSHEIAVNVIAECSAIHISHAITGESPATAHNGSHDFDFVIGNWKTHVRRLPIALLVPTAYTTPIRLNGASICSIWTKAFRPWLAN